MPVNVLIIRALLNLYHFYGNDFKVQCPTGSGHYMTLFEVAQELSRRLAGTSARCQWTPASIRRHRKVPGGSALARSDPFSTNTFMATTARGSAQAIRPDGLD